MADISKGITFADSNVNGTEDVTNVTLHSLIDDATMVNVPKGEFSDMAIVLQVSATPPTAQTGTDDDDSLWYEQGAHDVRMNAGQNNWDSYVHGPCLTYSEAVTAPKGSVMIVDPSTNLKCTRNGLDQHVPEVLGVVTAHTPPGSHPVIRSRGWAEVLLEGPVTRGDQITTSATAAEGWAKSATLLGVNGDYAAGTAFGMAFVNVSSGATALATCWLWR